MSPWNTEDELPVRLLNQDLMFHPIDEKKQHRSRRDFLHAAGALTVGTAASGPTLPTTGSNDPVAAFPAAGRSEPGKKPSPLPQVGILLGTFDEPSLEARMDAARACGIECVQVSMDCAGFPLLPENIPPELTDRIRLGAESRGIAIAAVQGTFNMSHPDVEHRRIGLHRLRVLAEACPRMGANIIHLCTGTRDQENMWRRHSDNDLPAAWRDMTACMREAEGIARQFKVVLAFEPEVNNVVDSARKAKLLLDEIGSTHLKVTIDPANLFHAGELPRMKEILDEAFSLLGRDIVLAHAKDLDRDGDAGHLAAGQGKLDYDRYLSLLQGCGFHGPILLHGLSEAQIPGCIAFLKERLARLA